MPKRRFNNVSAFFPALIDSLKKLYGNKKSSISQGDAAVEFFVPKEL